ncbi:bifunctional hydroxymethylpyrimidine kinase/phosphomethylpyrimidine kinase [Desulfovibrio ferrophilus]|uniref:hydroxymethylpyrimidine kinase n=1 Tax=Desulfovibrio ferrophilus TaxID=241368 RepID=A0A2Z6AXE5_9BACT|nr:bifunctional hydroxymethylpyrimidine kinase/phosphomethylpyrimidine kinase [Desulfovibrio ferrophilus]BBD07890.1 phosphomethylpyrimidine kinase [Desulfovibrio ferrophilus]
MPNPPSILTIAGSDSGGGAGIQADLKTFAMLGGYGMSVITALTAQNSMGVTGIEAPSAEFVALQLTTVLEDFEVAAAKTGMLFSASIIESLAEKLEGKNFPLVVDPVCVSQSGHRLLQEDAVQALRERMLPLADLLTPNRPEAELLANIEIAGEVDLHEAAARLHDMGAGAVLIKGGHFDESELGQGRMADWLFMPGHEPLVLEQERVETTNTHGTGCTLSAAIAAGLGHGLHLDQAISLAQEYLNLGLRTGFAPGRGCGPINHSATLQYGLRGDMSEDVVARVAELTAKYGF